MNTKTLIAFCSVFWILTDPGFGVPPGALARVESPNKQYAIKVSGADDGISYRLSLVHLDREIAHYNFEGELVSAYWSPSYRYVAINNHSGHAGWYLWILSLQSGAVIRTGGEIRDANYDRYMDNDYEPSLELADKKIRDLYPQVNSDTSRTHYISIAYGWKGEDKLLMFHEFIFDKLFEQQQARISLCTTFRVRGQHGITVTDILAKKVTGKSRDSYPDKVKKTLGE